MDEYMPSPGKNGQICERKASGTSREDILLIVRKLKNKQTGKFSNLGELHSSN